MTTDLSRREIVLKGAAATLAGVGLVALSGVKDDRG
jgi:hypothetical protein